LGKIAEYLRSHLDGEITDASDVREHFSQDAGLLKITPQTVLYPFNEQDVRKVSRFAWQLAEKGKKVALTSRGLGSDWSGGAVGDGITIAFSAHMNKVIELDSRRGEMVVEPGAVLGKINQSLITHGLFMPIDPISSEFSTLGGALATNASGFHSAKYGSMLKNTIGLRVVLSSGEVIETHRIPKREVRKKMGLSTFEGEIYRGLDALLNDNAEAMAGYQGSTQFAPLNVFDVRKKDGSVDLTPLFIGSQGTLGVITQAKVKISAYNPAFKHVICGFYNAEQYFAVAAEIAKLHPSIYTVIPKASMQLFAGLNPMYVGKQFGDKLPEYLVLLEWDEFSSRYQKKMLRRLKKLCSKSEVTMHVASTEHSKETIAKFYRIPSVLLQSEIEQARAVPGMDSSYVPDDKIAAVWQEVDALMASVKTRYVSWYDYAIGVFRVFPYLDLRHLGQRQKLAKIMESFNPIIVSHGGASGSHGGGRYAADEHKEMVGDALYAMMSKVKELFDPYNVMNPGVKFGTDRRSLSTKMVQGYSLSARHDYLPK
jgi:FAD/FMN-containing dehydrogenase